MKAIKVKYHTDINPIEQTKNGDWIDMRAAETVTLQKGEFKLISLGVSMKLPKGYEAHIVPRSSTYKTFKVLQANHCGIVDNSYSGDNDIWKFPALAMSNTTIQKNDRICQFRLVKSQEKLKIETVNKLDDNNRGGFGSTGVR